MHKTYPATASLQNLIIFLHGYNDCIANHEQTADLLCQKLPHAQIVLPQSDEPCDKNPQQRQWFGMMSYDAENKRTQPETSVPEIFRIYHKAEADICRCSGEINNFINTLQQKYLIDNRHTYLIGFSQGAMLTIYTALSRTTTLGGAFVLSGLVAGRASLAEKINSQPPLYLFHGKKDLKVQYKTVKSTATWLRHRGIPTTVFSFDNLSHHVTEQEIDIIADIINSTTAKFR
ncbi:MAG: dienelactone hydrolase family protein [Pseudomonadota bacterium]|nr:dienelactone hydrolase family protein [Pseudomonadota bacterium]